MIGGPSRLNPGGDMNIDQARQHIGQMVMSTDAGRKLIRRVQVPHGPYRLLKVTKGGVAILEGREEFRIPPLLLSACQEQSLCQNP